MWSDSELNGGKWRFLAWKILAISGILALRCRQCGSSGVEAVGMKVEPLCLSGEERMYEHNESRPTYVFELSEEARRLEQQGRFLAPLTRRLCEDAGITAGMKVLD